MNSANIGTPKAEVTITPNLVQQLLKTQFPNFAAFPIRFLGNGWDNTMYQLGKDYLIRLPRRQMAAQLIKNEQNWLPQIATQLPINIPVPIKAGRPQTNYPWHWSIIPWFYGQTADLVSLNMQHAIQIGQFLKALHILAPSNLPENTARGVPLIEKAQAAKERFVRLQLKTDLVTKKIEHLWQQALETNLPKVDYLLHGDLHPRNILANKQAITAIIDWGDITSGDAATDLACLWMLFEEEKFRQQALEIYQPSSDLLARAKGWAVYFGSILLDTGLVDHPQHAKIGAATLTQLM